VTGEFGLAEETEGAPGDEFEEIDVADTEADRIARRQDREFSEFRKRLKDTEQFKLDDGAFDDATYAAIYKLVQDGHVGAMGGPISTGKEANVYEALDGDGGDVAVKVYRINASNFKQMRDYLEGDPRFEGLRGDKKAVVLSWTRKEFSNLQRAAAAGVRVPEPLAVQRNVLVMELIGQEGDAADRLSEVSIENPETAYEVVREYVRRLYDAGLVHGDLSEYNIVVEEGELVVIDVGQAVTIHHPNHEDLLRRDCRNVANFFARQGADVSPDGLYEYVVEHANPRTEADTDDPRTADEDGDAEESGEDGDPGGA
jgi:RIO kinase 1